MESANNTQSNIFIISFYRYTDTSLYIYGMYSGRIKFNSTLYNQLFLVKPFFALKAFYTNCVTYICSYTINVCMFVYLRNRLINSFLHSINYLNYSYNLPHLFNRFNNKRRQYNMGESTNK